MTAISTWVARAICCGFVFVATLAGHVGSAEAGVVYTFTGTCTSSIFYPTFTPPVNYACPASIGGRIVMPDDYVPGTLLSWFNPDPVVSFSINDDQLGGGPGGVFSTILTHSSGFIRLPVDSGFGLFEYTHDFASQGISIRADGTYRIFADQGGFPSQFYVTTGTNIVFQRVGTAGTAYLAALGLLALALTRNRKRIAE